MDQTDLFKIIHFQYDHLQKKKKKKKNKEKILRNNFAENVNMNVQ